MNDEQMKELKRFNENVDWLKNGQSFTVQTEYVNIKEAMQILDRQRTWIQTRLVKEYTPGIDTSGILIRGADWRREGNRLMFRRESINRLKNEVLTAIGNKYDQV